METVSEQLPESRRWVETQKALKEFRSGLQRRTPPTVAIVLKVPKPAADFVEAQMKAEGFDTRQGYILSLINQMMKKKAVG